MYCVFNTLNFYEIFKILRCVKKKRLPMKTVLILSSFFFFCVPPRLFCDPQGLPVK